MKKSIIALCGVAMMGSVAMAGTDIDTSTEVVVEQPVTEMQVQEYTGFYAGLGLSDVASRDTGVSLSFTGEEAGADRVWGVSLLAGYTVNQYMAIEGRYTASFTKEDISEMRGLSIYVKPQYPVNDDFSVYALLGYGSVTLDSINGSGVDVDDSGFQWGLGASYDVTDEVSVFVDYTMLANDMDGHFTHNDGADVDALTIGVNYRF